MYGSMAYWSNLLEAEIRINLNLAINYYRYVNKTINMRYSSKPKERRYVKGYGFLSFTKNMGKNFACKYN